MSTKSPRKPPVHLTLPFGVAIEVFLKVDPKKLPQNGKVTVKKKGKAMGSNQAEG